MMTLRPTSISRSCLFLILAGGATLSALRLDAEPNAMGVYRHSDGQAYFSLSMGPAVQPEAASTTDRAREVVVLFDTSASQTSMYRDAALASLDAMLESLSPSDHVQLAAVDLDARMMSEQAASPGSPEMLAAVAKLHQEAPLGTTDLVTSLETTLTLFDTAGSAPRVVVYIGDGMSNGNLLQARSFARLVEQLRQARVSVSSYAIGPQKDSEVLAALANQTGGNLYVDAPMAWADEAQGVTAERATAENERRAAGVGRVLADWVRAGVVWPENVMTSGIETLFPAALPPLRTDRDTAVIGTLDPAAETISLSAQTSTETIELARPVADSNEAYAYLAQLVEEARRDGGATLPTVGSAGLAETGRLLLARVDNLTGIAERAASIGDKESAARIADAVLRRDPGNLRAKTVQRVVQKGDTAAPFFNEPPAPRRAQKTRSERKPAADGALEMVRTAQVEMLAPPTGRGSSQIVTGDGVVIGSSALDSVAASDYPPAGEVTDGRFLNSVERRNRLFAQMLEKEIRNTIRQARDKMTTSPGEATQDLKLAMQSLQNAPELIADVRASLSDRLETALREAARSATVKAEIDRQREETAAAARERKIINDRLSLRRQREKQLMDRFNALMDERRYDEAEDVASIAAEIDPDGVTPIAADWWAATSRAHYLNQTIRAARAKGYIRSLLQVELAAIPIPDEPPIVYPEASVWEELTNRRKKYQAVDLKSQGEAELRITEALQGPLTSIGLDFTETPLEEVVEFLRSEYQIEIQLDTPSLDELGIGPDEPITVNLRNVSLRSALRFMLKQLELTYIIKDEVLQITTEEAAELELTVKVYPVGDLVIDKTPIQGGGGGGIGGGGGGGFGGGGGGGFGGGGGGFGGGGGGFGGGGGGNFGGGGGQFSVPESTEQQAPGALVLSKSIEEPQAEAKRPRRQQAGLKATPKIVINKKVSAEQFWSDYFKQSSPDPAALRQSARQLMKSQRFDHVIALVQNALRSGHPQPWMYEALGIALQLSGSSPQQVERAVMSAVDFSTTPEELMLIAQYLLSLELDHRAIQVYQQVAKIDPARDETYLLALRAAERTNHLDGILWATEQILSRAWPAEQSGIEKLALQIAKATLREMEAKGMKKELADYRQRLQQALVRDCLVTVSWTGSADIDLIVEEPTGAICSQTQPRTAGGGINLGDSYAVENANTVGGFNETYVCPKAFAGSYRVLVRRVWGEVTAGKVTVEVVTNYLSPDAKHERQTIDLAKGEAVVRFDLDQGRREEPIEEQQLARAIDRQRAIGQAVLAQQISSLSDPRATPVRPEDRIRRQTQLRSGGAVGFQPVIQTLQDGTSLTVNAVASADRRYVIIRPSPVFSTIGDVSTFTFAGSGGANGGADADATATNTTTVNNNTNFFFPGPQNEEAAEEAAADGG